MSRHTHHVPPQTQAVPGYRSGGRALTLPDARLNRVFQREPERCATLSEYARASGIETGRVMDLLSAALDSGAISFEPVGPEIFVHTAPAGRPTPIGVPEVSPNLWERLRVHGNKQNAYQLWTLLRSMENAGWVVEANTASIMFSLAPVAPVPELGLTIGNQVFPLMIRPRLEELSTPGQRFNQLSVAGARLVGIIVESGALEETVTAIRRQWMHQYSTSTIALILEGPRYNPVQLSATDASVAPRSVTRADLENSDLAR